MKIKACKVRPNKSSAKSQSKLLIEKKKKNTWICEKSNSSITYVFITVMGCFNWVMTCWYKTGSRARKGTEKQTHTVGWRTAAGSRLAQKIHRTLRSQAICSSAPCPIRLLQQRDLQRMIAALCKRHQYQYFDGHSEVAEQFSQHYSSVVNSFA